MKQLAAVLLAVTLSVALAACGSGGNEGASGGGGNEKAPDAKSASELTVEAVNWKFDKEEYKVPAGKVTVTLKSKEGYHGITIEGTDLKIKGDGSGTVDLKPGTYTIRCIIPCGDGHKDMTSKLIVE